MKELFEHWNKFLISEDAQNVATADGEEMVLRLPQFRISEQWGTPGSDDRKIIEMFTSKISGGSIKEKLASLSSFVSECDAGCASQKDVSEILASLVFLDSLSSVIYDFNPMTGGFLFETLISALCGGRQIETVGGADQTTIDMIDGQGRNLSLKFLFSKDYNYVEASETNLRLTIEKSGKPLIYLIGLKNRQHKDGKILAIDFYEFAVGAGNIEGDFSLERDFGKAGLSSGKWRNSRYFIGTLNFGSRQEIRQIAENYTQRLGSVLIEIYQQLDLLSKNVNQYYLQAPDAKDSGLKARQNAQTLKQDTEELS